MGECEGCPVYRFCLFHNPKIAIPVYIATAIILVLYLIGVVWF